MSKVHSMQEIANTGSLPMTKAEIPASGLDARMLAANLVAEVLVHVKDDSKVWQGFALRLIRGTTDFRAAFVKGMKEQLAEIRKRNAEAYGSIAKDGTPDPTKNETKMAGKLVATATVYVSKLTSIANAFNAAATAEGLIHEVAEQRRVRPENITLESIGFTLMADYASKFGDSKAGRKADPFLVKLGKWLDTQGKPAAEAGSDADKAQYEQVLALVNRLQG
jgi:hypothetical protein